MLLAYFVYKFTRHLLDPTPCADLDIQTNIIPELQDQQTVRLIEGIQLQNNVSI